MKLVNNFHGDLKGDDNNTYQNGGDDSDVIDDVTDAINGTKGGYHSKKEKKSCEFSQLGGVIPKV